MALQGRNFPVRNLVPVWRNPRVAEFQPGDPSPSLGGGRFSFRQKFCEAVEFQSDGPSSIHGECRRLCNFISLSIAPLFLSYCAII